MQNFDSIVEVFSLRAEVSCRIRDQSLQLFSPLSIRLQYHSIDASWPAVLRDTRTRSAQQTVGHAMASIKSHLLGRSNIVRGGCGIMSGQDSESGTYQASYLEAI